MDDYLNYMIPKAPTQVDQFLSAYPQFDGRNIRVAVLDTGVDPGAAGLQVTTEGLPKVIDIRDCSGDGAVEMVKMASANPVQKPNNSGKDEQKSGQMSTEEGDMVEDYYVIEGLRKEELKISKKVFDMNPSNKWFIGEKAVYTFFNSAVVKKLKSLENEKNKVYHDVVLKAAETEMKKNKDGSMRDELQARLNILQSSKSEISSSSQNESKGIVGISDPGLVVTCLVFRDSRGIFRALIDKTGDGDFRASVPLASYRIEQQFDKWSYETQMNYCVDISLQQDSLKEHEGDVIFEFSEDNLNSLILNIVTDSGSHGTHVASILAGYHPENTALNGIAPGAQIVSLKIGDGRLDGMETAKSIIKAVSLAVNLGCDIINMSFGEASLSCESGRVLEIISDAVRCHGIIFVTSAGNSGPSLSTIGAPGCSSTNLVISIGAYLNDEMKAAQYSHINQLNESNLDPSSIQNVGYVYDWTSRGPTYNSNLGVSLCAPGGAVASVPEWVLSQKQQKNGTSMASPNACGAICLLLSALKAQNLKYSSPRIKRILENSAKYVSDVEIFAQGNGLIQIQDAYNLIMKEFALFQNKDAFFYLDLPMAVSVQSVKNFGSKPSGIYLRQNQYLSSPSNHTVSISSGFCDATGYSNADNDYVFNASATANGTNNRGKYLVTRWPTELRNKLQINFKIVCDAGWVKATERVFYHGEEEINVVVDPRKLNPGCHFAWINVFDEDRQKFSAKDTSGMGFGPLLRIPVTVVVPMNMRESVQGFARGSSEILLDYQKEMNFTAGKVERVYLAVPFGATWVDLKLTVKSTELAGSSHNESEDESNMQRLFYLCCSQMSPNGSYRDDSKTKYSWLDSSTNSECLYSFDVFYPGIVEVTVCQSWRYLGRGGVISLDCKFQGVSVSPNELSFSVEGDFTSAVSVANEVRNCRLSPSASFSEIHRFLSPLSTTNPLIVETWTNDILPFEYQPEFLSLDYYAENPGEVKNKKKKSILGKLFNKLQNENAKAKIEENMKDVRRRTSILILEYEFENDINDNIRISVPHLNDMLYENPLDCQMLMFYNNQGRLIQCNDAYPKFKYLEKGKYFLRLCLAHEDQSFLNKFSSTRLLVSRKYEVPVSLKCFSTKASLVAGKNFGSLNFVKGNVENVFIKMSQNERLPSYLKPGDVVRGEMFFVDRSTTSPHKKTNGYKFTYFHTVVKERSENSGGGSLGSSMFDLLNLLQGFGTTGPEEVVEESEENLSTDENQLALIVPNLRSRITRFNNSKDDYVATEKEFKELETLIEEEKNEQNAPTIESLKLDLLKTRLSKAVDDYRTNSNLKNAATLRDLCAEIIDALEVKSKQGSSSKQDKVLSEAIYVSVYIRLSTDQVTPETLKSAAEDIDKLAKLLKQSSHIKVKQLKLEMISKQGFCGMAISLLDDILRKDEKLLQNLLFPITFMELQKRRITLCEALMWFHLAKNGKRALRLNHPVSKELF